MSYPKERLHWQAVKEMMGDSRVSLGPYLSYQFANTPRRVLYSMSYYKFASKMIGPGKRVLDIGCGEGLGTWLLAMECGRAKGIDTDPDLIKVGKKNWADPKISFECCDFLTTKQEKQDAIVGFDIIEHIMPANSSKFFEKIRDSLIPDGMVVIGTPNSTSEQYASEITKAGHVNLYSGERIEQEMGRYFSHVFIFGANDEVVHTGFLPMAHYLIAVACGKPAGRAS